MTSTHLTAAPTKEVSMLIQSTDGTRASYVSTSFQPEVMNIDGSDADWNGGNALNPSGYAMPGIMSGDGTNDMMVTYIEGDDLYIGLTGEDLSTSDLLIYLSVGWRRKQHWLQPRWSSHPAIPSQLRALGRQ